MKLIKLEKVREGKYLKNYELEYLNKAGKQKKYEMISHKNLEAPEELGRHISGISIVAMCGEKMLLLKEFRMAVNRSVYGLCAGMLESGESLEECIRRELYEETGLSLVQIDTVLPPAFAAVSLTDIKNQIVFVKAKGTLADHTSENEEIKAGLYTMDEVGALLKTEEFSARAQVMAYFFSLGFFNKNI